MRNLLACLAAVVLVVGVTGWCRGWYTVEALPADLGKLAFKVEIDRIQIASDAVDTVKAVRKLASSVERKEQKKGEAIPEGKGESMP